MLMDTSSVGHFAALSFIVAPAMLTNASALMGLSSSNRLAIATQRTREMALQLESAETLCSDEAKNCFEEMSASAERSQLLIRALRSFYLAMGAFALATLLSLLGLAMETFDPLGLVRPLEICALGAGVLAFGGLVNGSVQLLRETHLAVRQLEKRSANLRAKFEAWQRREGA